jgi:TolB-like protein/Tfp pilus assembly protein PilF
MAALLAVAAWPGGRFVGQSSPPRLSLVVLPFQNLSGSTADDYLADGITDDLTTELAHIVGARVVARETARNLKRQADDVRAVGKQLGVRYVIEGGVRRLGTVLHANVRLVSVETAENLWSDRLDEAIGEGLAGQEHIVMRMGDQLAINMVEIESARSLRERPTNPDAFDLILRARSIRHLPESPQRNEQVRTLSERALALDPTSLYAMTDVAYALTDAAAEQGWASLAEMERAGRLLDEARARAPAADFVLNTYVFWLRTVGRCPETIELAQRALEAEPKRMRVWTGIYNELATCKLWAGHADQALALHAEADRLNPYSPWKFVRYHQMGKASLLLGREQDGIAFLERAIAMNRNDQWAHRWLAAAYALAGRVDEAKRSLGEANRLWPYNTVRGFSAGSNAYAVQTARFREALRLAGERDHADEDADFGLPPDGALHNEVAGRTPVSVLGASTIRTAELAHMIAESRPVIVDTMSVSSGQSIRGAVGLKFAGLGGSLDDAAQVRLARKMRELTAGDLGRPIVAVGWNSERFDGRNLALRLVALGYTHVYWYRSGREAWEVAGLPEGPLNAQEW